MVSGNNIDLGLKGINLQWASDNIVTGNSINDCTDIGIHFTGNGNISDNFILGSATGIYFTTAAMVAVNSNSTFSCSINWQASSVSKYRINNHCDLGGFCQNLSF
jgi:hypothetical protein